MAAIIYANTPVKAMGAPLSSNFMRAGSFYPVQINIIKKKNIFQQLIRLFSPSLLSDRYLKLGSISDHRADTSRNIVPAPNYFPSLC